jgi:hypothetical protein
MIYLKCQRNTNLNTDHFINEKYKEKTDSQQRNYFLMAYA